MAVVTAITQAPRLRRRVLTGSASLPSLWDRLRRPLARWCGSATGDCHASIVLACQSLIRRLMVGRFAPAVIGHGGAIAYEWEEVDKERFVKLYIAGLKQAAGLSKAGLAVFETVYKQVRERPGQDTAPLDSFSSNLHPVTYRRGLRELLEKEFLFRSPNPGLFFVNIRFMFNGDRLAFVKGYRIKKEQPTLPGLELDQSA